MIPTKRIKEPSPDPHEALADVTLHIGRHGKRDTMVIDKKL